MNEVIIRTVAITDGSLRIEVSAERLNDEVRSVAYSVEINKPHDSWTWVPSDEARVALVEALGGTVA